MAFDTVRTNKMRSGLTVLGVVIGITSIVGMTAMIRGFDESLRDMIRTIGPKDHHPPARGPAQLRERRRVRRDHEAAQPHDLRRARHRSGSVATIQVVDIQLGAPGLAPPTQERVFYRTCGRGR